jgi:REP element-mobilizing transposase RayT
MVYGVSPMKQTSFFQNTPPVHGGELALQKRKNRRPLARKRPIHLILKAKKAFQEHSALIHQETKRLAAKFGIKIYDTALANDHFHLVLTIPSRKDYVAFIRALTGLLARKLGKGLCLLLPFSRVSNWGKAYRALRKYLEQNRLETAGLTPYKKRKDYYRKWRRSKPAH